MLRALESRFAWVGVGWVCCRWGIWVPLEAGRSIRGVGHRAECRGVGVCVCF